VCRGISKRSLHDREGRERRILRQATRGGRPRRRPGFRRRGQHTPRWQCHVSTWRSSWKSNLATNRIDRDPPIWADWQSWNTGLERASRRRPACTGATEDVAPNTPGTPSRPWLSCLRNRPAALRDLTTVSSRSLPILWCWSTRSSN